MRSVGMLAVVAGALALASGCSDGAGTPPDDNAAPVANFTAPSCTINVDCNFASTSTDDAGVTSWSWDFDGDGHADATTASAAHMYGSAAAYNVSLTVGDAQGLTNTKTSTITIAAGNAAPVADFTLPSCSMNESCDFASTSSDDVAVTGWSWDFDGNGIPDATTANASYTFAAATSYNVSLTVRDAAGLTNTKTSAITVAPPPVNTPPTAGFVYTCDDGVCRFTSTSTDAAPGTIAIHAWSFGDGFASAEKNPKHNYAVTVPTPLTVSLTVTDDRGDTDTETQTITVSPPVAAQGCYRDGAILDCALDVPARSIMKVKLLGISCGLPEERLVTPPYIGDQVFLGVCRRTVGEEIGIFGGFLDTPIIYEAGSQVWLRFVQGTPDKNHPVLAAPTAQISGTFPDWTISFEDGASPDVAGEPDFADLIVGVHATLK